MRELKNRLNNEVRDATGVYAEALNRYYARSLGHDSNYVEPRLKHTINLNREQQITEPEVFVILDTLKKTVTGLDKLTPRLVLPSGSPSFAKRVTSLEIAHFKRVRCLVSGGAR